MIEAWKTYLTCGVAVVLVFLLGISCSGGSDSPAPHFTDNGGTPNLQGNVTPGDGGTGNATPGTPAAGALTSAPLGTDTAFGTQEISELIQTNLVGSGTSSARSASADDRVLWVAITLRGQDPDPGLPSPPITEGDDIDLHIRYNVFPGELSISRQWVLEAAGLNYVEPSVSHAEAGTYHAVFPFTLAYGTGTDEATFMGIVGPQRTSSVVVIPDMHDYREVEFEIVPVETLAPIHYPVSNPDSLNSSTTHGEDCLTNTITVQFNGTSIYVTTTLKSISSVVLQFEDGTTELWHGAGDMYAGEFFGTGENAGKTIIRAWVKSGCNESGEGPGYGERFEPLQQDLMAMAQFAWDDDANLPDYDYNDFVGRMRIAEIRTTANEMVQMQLTAKALARGSSNVAEWQFNVDASFPGATEVFAVVNQFYADGTPHGPQRIYVSSDGATIPVFSPTADAFPSPPGTATVNCVAGSTYYDGDYAEVIVILSEPQPQGTYSSIPYEPELYVSYGEDEFGNPLVETIPLWSEPGDELNADGFPQAFIIPDTYAWALEGEDFDDVYPEFTGWINWINDQSLPEPSPPWWQWDPVDSSQYFQHSLFN